MRSERRTGAVPPVCYSRTPVGPPFVSLVRAQEFVLYNLSISLNISTRSWNSTHRSRPSTLLFLQSSIVMCSASTFALISLILTIPFANAQTANQAYTPVAQTCANGTTLVRLAGTGSVQTLNPQEQAYVSSRRNNTLPNAWQNYLSNVQAVAQAQNVTVPSYISSLLNGSSSNASVFPTLGIAASGGGYRAAAFSAGVLNAFDSRNPASVNAGTGGLLQVASYISASSGASWLVGSIAQGDFPTINQLVFGTNGNASSAPTNATIPNANANTTFNGWGGWLTQYGLLNPAPNSSPAVQQAYITEMMNEVAGKAQAGFPVTFSDIMGRALARHFTNGTNATNFFDFMDGGNVSTQGSHGAGILWSQIPNLYVTVSWVTITSNKTFTFAGKVSRTALSLSPS